MTSLLYITADMEKSNDVESVIPCSGRYSFSQDLRLNAWLGVAVLVYLGQRWLLKHNPDWPPLWRGTVALAPLAPAMLYIRSWIRFIGGLDELQRRVQLEAHLFAAWGTLIVGVVISALTQQGVLTLVPHGLGFGGVMVCLFPLWSLGVVLANRRYK